MIITNLLLNMVVLTVHGAIPTNTPAFQQYAFELLLTNAQATAAKWCLDQSLVTAKNVTWFEAVAYPHGPTATMVFGNRYLFRTWDGDFTDYSDEAFYERSVFSF